MWGRRSVLRGGSTRWRVSTWNSTSLRRGDIARRHLGSSAAVRLRIKVLTGLYIAGPVIARGSSSGLIDHKGGSIVFPQVKTR